jgi:hypothetical protein
MSAGGDWTNKALPRAGSAVHAACGQAGCAKAGQETSGREEMGICDACKHDAYARHRHQRPETRQSDGPRYDGDLQHMCRRG